MGLIQLYFGRGKGKTTAAIGLGLRASGHGFKVNMIQFMKGNTKYGELNAVKGIENFEIHQFGRMDLIMEPEKIDIEEGKKALKYAEEIIMSDNYDLVILDEIGVALEMHIIKIDDVMNLIEKKPEKVELILTGGQKIHPKIKEIADLITEMKMVKHYFSTDGIQARLGIEF